MRIVVQKYGGSSVADAERIKKVAARIKETRDTGVNVVVVVSAMGKTTDGLIARAAEVSPSPSRRELDMLLSCGERISMALLAMAVQELGIDAVSFTGSQSGIITNDRHSGARILEVRPYRVQDELEKGKVVIVAGFQGVSYKAEVTTLGRGGSDTTAVALAGALGAEYCEICSDVDGVYTADPRIISAAELLHAISHEELLELTTHGAKVLHPESVEFARKLGVALYARATFQPPGVGGTRVDRTPESTSGQNVSGVSVMRRLVRLRATGLEAMDRMLAAATEASLPVLRLDADHEIADLWFALDDVPDWTKVRARLVGQVEIEDGLAAVSLVGEFVGRNAGHLLRTRSIAAGAGIAVKAMTATPLRVTLFCKEPEADELARLFHRTFRELTS